MLIVIEMKWLKVDIILEFFSVHLERQQTSQSPHHAFNPHCFPFLAEQVKKLSNPLRAVTIAAPLLASWSMMSQDAVRLTI